MAKGARVSIEKQDKGSPCVAKQNVMIISQKLVFIPCSFAGYLAVCKKNDNVVFHLCHDIYPIVAVALTKSIERTPLSKAVYFHG